MTHNNRNRLSVNLMGNWKFFSNTLPAGATAIGTVTRGIGDTGALIRFEATGIHSQLNAGAIRNLDQFRVLAAIKSATYDDLLNPYHADFEEGREDASQFNPYFIPGERAGEALQAYKAGYQFGTDCMDEYYAEQED